ncbi:MAG TPA: hypothetical protein VFO10_27855 [Oligoflexus sp.]|uniref:hypothetical protein n=1 Tax=Oligoflexus sp. TaxID=1971216 RepID=UPI002D80D35D|nr:hypothetical protein [Oligoflexus sp.]HET9241112.1 hypothetical protein [Oligoflexus sp.]
MRRAILCLALTFIGCEAAPKPQSQRTPEPESRSEPEKAPQPETVVTTPPAPVAPVSEPMDMVALKPEVDAVYAQNPKLSAEQAQGLSATTMQLIEASKAGDQKAISGLSSQLLNQALLGRPSFGLVDAGGLAKAIQDLVAAAINADVAGILDAVEDIVAAVTA